MSFPQLRSPNFGEIQPTVETQTDVFIDSLHKIEQGMVTVTAASMGGVLTE